MDGSPFSVIGVLAHDDNDEPALRYRFRGSIHNFQLVQFVVVNAGDIHCSHVL